LIQFKTLHLGERSSLLFNLSLTFGDEEEDFPELGQQFAFFTHLKFDL